MHDALRFIQALTGDAGTTCVFQVLPDSATSAVTEAVKKGTYAQVRHDLDQANAAGGGIFLTINDTGGKRRVAENVKGVRALFIDSDGKAVERFAAEPSIVCKRDATHFHAYWLLKKGEDILRWRSAQRALANHYGSDRKVCDLPRVMRLPGYMHCKGAPVPYALAHADAGVVYTIDQVMEKHGIDPRTITAAVEEKSTGVCLDGHEATEAERGILASRLQAMAEKYDNAPDAYSRDGMMGAWVIDAVRAALPEHEIITMATAWLEERGRAPQPNEVVNWIRSAKRGLPSGKFTSSVPGIRPDQDFGDVPASPTLPKAAAEAQADDLVDWQAEIPRSGNSWKSHPRTVQLILAHDKRVNQCLRYNQFSKVIEVTGKPPWRTWQAEPDFIDPDITGLQCWIARAYDHKPTIDAGHIHAAVAVHARQHGYHPVRDYLHSLKWDGTKRLDTWLRVYLGALGSARYTQAVGAKTLIAAVARVMSPGYKHDTMLILEGHQGSGKSTAVRILGGDWYDDSHLDISSKEGAGLIRSAWIFEMPELHSMKRAELTLLKAFITRQCDRQRDAYARCYETHPRQSIFIGTTNQEDYLRDETGNRRFWPVKCGAIDLPRLRADRDQLWAEALVRFNAGEQTHLEDDVAAEAVVEQEARMDADVWEDKVAAYLANPTTPGTLTAAEIYTSAITAQVPADAIALRRVGSIARKLGWERKQVWRDGRNVKVFAK